MTFTAGQRLTASLLNAAIANSPQLIQTQTLTGTQASVTFAGIPSSYNFLRLEWRVHLNAGGATDLQMQVDGNSGSNYIWSKMEAASATQMNTHAGAATTFMKIGATGSTTASYFGNGSLTIGGWANSNGFLTFSGTSTYFDSNTVDYIGTYGGLYAGNAPHNSLLIYPASNSFIAGSQFSLYGVN